MSLSIKQVIYLGNTPVTSLNALESTPVNIGASIL